MGEGHLTTGIRALALALFLVMGLTGSAVAAVEGDLDKSFSGDGELVTDFNAGVGADVRDAAVDSSGRLVVVGGDGGEIGVARFLPDGSFDPSFGGDGDVVIDSGTTSSGERAQAVAIDPATGNILIFGDAGINVAGNNTDLVFARLLPTGALDTTFDGPSGTGEGRFRLAFNNDENAFDVIALDSGELAAVATVGSGSTAVSRVMQLTNTGALDIADFGNPNGYFDFQYVAGAGSFAASLDQQDDGKIIAAGNHNGTGTYGVARITTTGALDTTFNPTGPVPGISRPALPATHIDASVADVQIDSGGGIVVAGEVLSGSPNFDLEPFLSRLSSAGLLDTSFGNTSGYAILPVASASEFAAFGSLEVLGSQLFAAGTVGPTTGGDPDQFAARYSATGVLDTSFNAAGPQPGVVRTDLGTSAAAVASPIANGTAFLVGQTFAPLSSRIGISAVCALVPPGCPVPSVPNLTAFVPGSGSNDNSPKLFGAVPAGPAVTSVTIYKDAACAGDVVATGTQANLETDGIQVSVPDNSSTTFYATATGANGTSACSAGLAYAEVTPPPQTPVAGPTGQRAAALKKCAKIKKKAKKKKCKKKARKLPV
jgi:uncharacterized delta-60 repeat protein